MKNMFSVGTDDLKFKVQRGNNTDSYNILKSLAVNFPFIKEPLGLDEATNTEKDFITKIRNMDIPVLLDYAIKSCEAYLLPEESTMTFTYPPNMTEGVNRNTLDKNTVVPVSTFNSDTRRLHIYPVNRFYQPVRLWLIMSALYSESLKGFDCQLQDRLGPLHFSEWESDDICNLLERSLKRNKRIREMCYDSSLDSYYDVMVINGLLSKEFLADGSIPTEETKNDPDKYSDRLPDKTIPAFAWKQKHNIDYDSQDLDFQLITQYLMEKTTGANLAHYREYVKTFMHDLNNHFTESNNSMPDSVFDSLTIYPLLHFRLHTIYYLLEADQESQEQSGPSREEWLKITDDLMYQAFVYFPLLDSIFHILLKIKYGKHSYHAELCDELKIVYESGLLYQKNYKLLTYPVNPGVRNKNIIIKLSDGQEFPIEYKKFRPPISPDVVKQVSIAWTVNYKNPDLINCIKDSFGSDYEKIKDIPEEMFLDFIEEITHELKGFVLLHDYKGYHMGDDYFTQDISKQASWSKIFNKHYETCVELSFPGYENIIKQIPVELFTDFVQEVIRVFDTNDYEYLFRHNKDGFAPIYWIRRDLEHGLYGVTLEELEDNLHLISKEVSQLDCNYDYIDESFKAHRSMAVKLDNCMDRAKSLVIRNYRYFGKTVAFLNKILGNENVILHFGKKVINKIEDNISQYKKSYNKLQEELIEHIKNICEDFNRIPTNDEYKNKRNNEVHKELKKSELLNIMEYMDRVQEFICIETKYSDYALQNYISKCKALTEGLNKEISDNLGLDVSNLRKGDTEFYGEMKKILKILSSYDDKKDTHNFIKEAQIFNSYDMIQLMKAIEYYSYLNSEYIRGFHDLKSVISCVMNNSGSIKDYRCRDNYTEFINQIKKEG